MSMFGRRLVDRASGLRSEFTWNRVISLGTLVVLTVSWELASQYGFIASQFFPPPTEIFQRFGQMYIQGEFLDHVGISLWRITIGFFVGAVLGIVTGLVMGISPTVRSIIDPWVSILYPFPKVVLLPVLFSLFGVGETARILTIAISVFLLVAINSMAGVIEIDRVYFDAARDNDVSRVSLLWEVILPGALPHVFTGLSLGMGLAFILIVVIEMIGADAGLGYVIWDSWGKFTITRMYVAIVTINVFGIVYIYGIEWLGKVLTPWK